MKIYTKTGDKGQTSLLSGKRVSKAHLRLEAYGSVDELNSGIGQLLSFATQDSQADSNDFLQNIQNQLFNIGSQLACDDEEVSKKMPAINTSMVAAIETQMDKMNESLAPLKNFILPGGSLSASQAHICRTVCRRCERICVELAASENILPLNIQYLNRLSDYLFVLARFYNHEQNIKDIEWKK